jgi:thioredoxin 2
MLGTEASTHAGTILTKCDRCGRTNRVAPGRVTEGPRCGACKGLLLAAPLDADDRTFARDVEQSPLPVLVDFWAPWCAPCRAFGPVLAEVARERAGRLKVVKVNVDEAPQTASRFDVRAVPTLVLFRNGRAMGQLRGALSKPALDAQLARLLG